MTIADLDEGSLDGTELVNALESAFRSMSKDERAFYLRKAWQEAKCGLPHRRLLALFRQAPRSLQGLPKGRTLRVYRGSWGPSRSSAQQKVRKGISWTLDRAIAKDFAERGLGFDFGPRPFKVGCLGHATVSRSTVLAYYHDDPQYSGDPGFYYEQECILDPSKPKQIRYSWLAPGGTWTE